MSFDLVGVCIPRARFSTVNTHVYLQCTQSTFQCLDSFSTSGSQCVLELKVLGERNDAGAGRNLASLVLPYSVPIIQLRHQIKRGRWWLRARGVIHVVEAAGSTGMLSFTRPDATPRCATKNCRTGCCSSSEGELPSKRALMQKPTSLWPARSSTNFCLKGRGAADTVQNQRLLHYLMYAEDLYMLVNTKGKSLFPL